MFFFQTSQRRIWAQILGLTSSILWKSKQNSKRIVYFFLKNKLLLEFSLNPVLKLTSFWTTQPCITTLGGKSANINYQKAFVHERELKNNKVSLSFYKVRYCWDKSNSSKHNEDLLITDWANSQTLYYTML